MTAVQQISESSSQELPERVLEELSAVNVPDFSPSMMMSSSQVCWRILVKISPKWIQ